MDADANGQVGGLDVPEEVRREYARQSREWTCDVCGESNERVLQGWKEDCRERGMDVDGHDHDHDQDQDKDSQQKINEEESNVENADRSPGTSTPAATAATPTTEPAPAVSPSPVATPAEPSTSETQAHRPPANIMRPGQAATIQDQASDGAWLDRAIIGVSVALIFMVLKRFVLTDEQA